MAWRGTEDIISALQTYFAANFTAKAAAINTDEGDTVSIAAPAAAAYGFGEHTVVNAWQFPFCYMIPTGGVVNFGAGATLARTTAEVTIGVVYCIDVADQSSVDNLTQQGARYLRAVHELVWDAMGAGSLSGWAPNSQEIPFVYGQQFVDSETEQVFSEVAAAYSFTKSETTT